MLYAVFSYVWFLFCSMLMLGLHAHIPNIMSMVMPYLDPHVCMHVLCSYAYVYGFICFMLGFLFFHTFTLTPTCLDIHSHAYMHMSMPICLDLCCHMLVCLDLCSPHALCHLPCACALNAMFMFVMPCAIVALLSLLSFFLVFWPNG